VGDDEAPEVADYIAKPYSPAAVRARVAQQLLLARQLRLNEADLARISALAEGANHFLAFANTDGGLEYVNTAACRMTGYTREQLLERGMELLCGDAFEDLPGQMFAHARQGGDYRFEQAITTASGDRRTMLFTLFKVLFHDGLLGVGISGLDVTEYRQLQDGQARARRTLEEAEAERQFYTQARTVMLQRLSHDMASPMEVIVGMTRLIRKERDSDAVGEYLDKIQAAATVFDRNLADIVDMAQVESGDLELHPTAFRLAALVNEAAERVTPRMRQHNQFLHVIIDDAIPVTLVADTSRLGQVVTNLLDYAAGNSPENGSVELECTLLELHDTGCVLQFDVRDTGEGLSAETLSHVWEAFDPSTGFDKGGDRSTLVLPLARYIIEQMGGTANVSSELHVGTEVTCTMPFAIASANELAIPEDEPAPALTPALLMPGTDTAFLEGKRILLVDDVPLNVDYLAGYLLAAGAEVESASNGADAINMFIERGYDAILMDLDMPVMSGFEAAENIRMQHSDDAATVRIVALCSRAGGSVVARTMQAGMDDHLVKPVDPASAIDVLRSFFDPKAVSQVPQDPWWQQGHRGQLVNNPL
jgi:PAS domain S-box-containing protein